jgi:hypothetical protein
MRGTWYLAISMAVAKDILYPSPVAFLRQTPKVTIKKNYNKGTTFKFGLRWFLYLFTKYHTLYFAFLSRTVKKLLTMLFLFLNLFYSALSKTVS